LSLEQAIAWLRTANPDLVRRLGAAPENQNRLIRIDIEAEIAKATGVQVQVHHNTQEALAYLRSKITNGELDLLEEDASSGELVKKSSEDAAALEIDKGTLRGRLPGGHWSDQFRLRTDQILRLRPKHTTAEQVATSPDSIPVPSNEVIPADPATAAKIAPNPTSVSVTRTEADPTGEAGSLSAVTATPAPRVVASPEAEPMLRHANAEHIRAALRAVYEDWESRGDCPPNVKACRRPVQDILARDGLYTSGRQIGEIAGEAEFKVRRRRPGRTRKAEGRSSVK